MLDNLEKILHSINDNPISYEAYVKEVKSFSTKIREYLSAYEGLDPTQTVTTDFDLPPYNEIEGKILPKMLRSPDFSWNKHRLRNISQ